MLRAPMLNDPDQNSTEHAPGNAPVDDMLAEPVPLSRLAQGAEALVLHSNVVDPALAEKLAARGIVAGAMLRVLQTGTPLMVRVDDTRWALSESDAAQVVVLPQAARSAAKPRGFRLWRR